MSASDAELFDQATDVTSYRKRNCKLVELSDGSKFLIKTPEVDKMGPHLESLAKLRESDSDDVIKEGGEKLVAWGVLAKELLPGIIMKPKITDVSTSSSITIGEIKFLDQVTLITEGMALSGLNATDMDEVKDFQKVPQVKA